MKKIKISFKHKVLIPTIILFGISVLVISVNNYRLMETTVQTKTNASLDIFTNNVYVQLNRIGIISDMVRQAINEKNLAAARAIAYILENSETTMTTEELEELAGIMDIIDICIVGGDGILQSSNIDGLVGFDYSISETTSKYLGLIDGSVTEIAEDPRASVVGIEEYVESSHYAGVPRTDNDGFIQVGFAVTAYEELMNQINIQNLIDGIKIENNGYGMVLYNGEVIAHPKDAKIGLDASGMAWYDGINSGNGFAWVDIDGEKFYAGYKNMDGYTIVGIVPETDYNAELKRALRDTVIFLSTALLVMIVVIYIIINNLLRPVKTVTAGLWEIADGNFDARVEGNYNDEFALIKDAINDMASNITIYLSEKLEAERIAHEAEIERLDLLIKVHHDSLTGVYNRRYLDENLGRIIRFLSRMGGTLSVLMMDIDFFKKYNDTYGHSEGDVCLISVTKALKSVIAREDDFIARCGGEEFVAVLPNTDENGARYIAEKMLAAVSDLKIKHENSDVASYVTISIGCTTGQTLFTQSGEDYTRRADEALYESKRGGRNKYTFREL